MHNVGLPGVSIYTTFVLTLSAFFTFSVTAESTKVVSTPNRFITVLSKVVVGP